ncbi:CYTH domain-containing protein [Flavobacteriaceae bacterium F08102]|nr:CYTH domain-containing protein [Flavobacteriaceae bacterium F08102]
MALEIERKFLVKNDSFKAEAQSSTTLVQGFLSSHKKRIVRVRIADGIGYLTVKGKTTDGGVSRFEWEKEISKEEAISLLKIAEKPLIEKIRYRIPYGNHCYEVDVFSGVNEGLIIAEIELKSIHEAYPIPSWLGKEVTGQRKYYNAILIKKPFSSWKK